MDKDIVYHPLRRELGEIRVLCFDTKTPIDDPAPLRCSLTTIQLTNEAHPHPSYSAISYCWGDATIRKPILIDGVSRSVPQNAELALRYLHCEYFSTTDWRQESHADPGDHQTQILADVIWIDSICINQDDLAERADQVSLMAQLYSQAAQVLIWLGEDNQSTTGPALASLKYASDQCRAETNGFRYPMTKLFDDAEAGRPSHHPEALRPIDWRALRMYFSASWFFRLWIVQEVLLAKVAYCCRGTYKVNFMLVGVGAAWLSSRAYGKTTVQGIRGLDLCSQLFRCRAGSTCPLEGRHAGDCTKGVCIKGLSLTYLLDNISNHQDCSEPKDRFYGIYGLVQDTLSRQHTPDYTLSLAKIYLAATTLAILSSGNLAVFISARDDERDLNQGKDLAWYIRNAWPTWVPFWHVRHDLPHQAYLPTGIYDASCSIEVRLHEPSPSPSPTSLVLDGITIDTIATSSRPFPHKAAPWRLVEIEEAIRSIWEMALTARRIPLTQTHAQALCVTLLVGQRDARLRSEALEQADIAATDFEAMVNGIINTAIPLPAPFDEEGWGGLRQNGGGAESMTNWRDSPEDSLQSWAYSSNGSAGNLESTATGGEDDNAAASPSWSETDATTHAPTIFSHSNDLVPSSTPAREPSPSFSAAAAAPPSPSISDRTSYEAYLKNDPHVAASTMVRQFHEPWSPLTQMSEYWENRRFFVTASGYMGLGPADTQPGDHVALLFGGSCPVVLRPGGSGSESQQHHYLVGLCYTHGIMNGEPVIQLRESGGLEGKIQVFDIR